MGLFTWMDSRVSKFRWFDISLLKGAVVAFTLMMARFFPEELLLLEWHWYFIVMILFGLRPWYIVFFKK
jgi:hypothetical protein